MVKLDERKELKDVTIIGSKDKFTIETFFQNSLIFVSFNKGDLQFLREEIDEWLVMQNELEASKPKGSLRPKEKR